MSLRASAILLLVLASPVAASMAERQYSVPTSAPEGHAFCYFEGSVKRTDPSDQATFALSPTTGEAALTLTLTLGPKGQTFMEGAFLGAGIQPGCDIFPNLPSTVPVPVLSPVKIQGFLDLHAHPGSDCLSAGLAEGAITASTTTGRLKLKSVKCDDDPMHGNLRLVADAPLTATKGETRTETVHIENHGPGDATHGVHLVASLSKHSFFTGAMPTQGVCHFVPEKHRVLCDLGPVPIYGSADVTVDAIPLAEGKTASSFTIVSEDDGTLLPRKAKTEGTVAKGNSAILSVEVKCKGAAGTVTINPNANGGVSTCTCPDPTDATREVVQCVEIYSQKTTVTLTPNATKGQFSKWTDACAGNPAACTVTLDPAAQNPDKSTTAKFK